MHNWKEQYDLIRQAIDADDMETADRLLNEQNAYIRTNVFTHEEVGDMLVQHQAIYELLAQRKENIRDLLMAQNNAQKVAKKYRDD